MVAEHDPGDEAEALDQAAAVADSEWLLPFPHDAVTTDESLAMMLSLGWDARAVYPSLVFLDGEGKAERRLVAPPFCPNRLQLLNYLGPVAMVRKASYQAAGGWGTGPWDLWRRLGKLKPVGEAYVGLRTLPRDLTFPAPSAPLKATFYNQATIPTTYYRCQLPTRHLPGICHPFIPMIDQPVEGDLVLGTHEGDAAVWQFPGDLVREKLMTQMQKQGIRTLVECDDTYLFRHETMGRAGWVSRDGDPSSGHSVERHRRIVGDADGVIVTCDALAKQYRKLNRNVYVCPNQVDPGDWPEYEKTDDGVFRIGWFASHSHRNDGALITSALSWAAKQPNVEVVLMSVGVTMIEKRIPDGSVESYGKPWWPFKFRYLPTSNDLATYWKLMMMLNVGLAPIVPNMWTECRSDVKALEYAMAGVCPVLADVAPYAHWKDGEGCLKAKGKGDFLKLVRRLVKNPSEAKELAAQAREHVLAERTVAHNIGLWEEAVAKPAS